MVSLELTWILSLSLDENLMEREFIKAKGNRD